jgi:polysaccharide biosynthesis protein PelF
MTHVLFVAEGSYPYVTGGVGKWSHDLIASLPEVEFTVLALWPTPGSEGSPRYPRPKNVREIRNVYLHHGIHGRDRTPPGFHDRVDDLNRALLSGRAVPLKGLTEGRWGERILRDPASWDRVCRLYDDGAPPGLPFSEFFWTWTSILQPVARMLEAPIPDVDLVHCISTGYAGLLGAVAQQRSGVPMVLTEHGIYTRERDQELRDIEWIPGAAYSDARRRGNFFKTWWRNAFASMEKAAYASSAEIVSLFEATRRYQISQGADAARCSVIPNGVDLALYDEIARRRRRNDAFHVGLVGRVVPIKDVRTFISACHLVARRLPPGGLRVSIVGPEDEDPDYARGCRDMVRLLGLSDIIEFTGRVDCRPYYEALDAVVLTSLSEGQPLSLLESLACGIPTVAPDVGSCRELIEGVTDEDRAAGAAGVVTRPVDPEGTAEALLRLAADPALRARMAEAGRRRVRRYYRLEQVRTRYLELYGRVASGAGRRALAEQRS